jgi:8-oxo-dGTP diphosphatase
VSFDAVVFRCISKDGLSILFVKRKIDPFKGCRILPEGLVLTEESLEDTVKREV